ncbi:MAG: hypothetical protein WCA84_18985 [Ignavibacteriaceae bacterium]
MEKTKIYFVLLATVIGISLSSAQTQNRRTENVIIITLDGFRWQELFGGIDTAIANNKNFTKEPEDIKYLFGASTPEKSRKKLLPFFWNVIAVDGQLYGNRTTGNFVNVANRYQFSYPGYNEMFTGYPDTNINSNHKNLNPNKNVLEFINQQEDFKDQVVVFTSWDVFPSILNRERSKLLINSGSEQLAIPGKQLSPEMKLLNQIQSGDPHFLGGDVREDLLTYYIGFEYIKEYHPRVAFLGFDGTDDLAHRGLYDYYLEQVHASDRCIAELWRFLQSDPQYKDKTTLILLCDHGRGDHFKRNWMEHGASIPESGETWLAVIGPDTPPLGEVQSKSQLYNKQVAPTIAAFLGLPFVPEHGNPEVISTMFK